MAGRWTRAIRGALRHCRLGSSGSVSIELALVTILLVVLGVGAFDFGRIGLEKAQLVSAVRAGTQFGVQDLSNANDINQMIQAARDDAGDTTGAIQIQARQYCACPGGEVACTSSCADGSYAPLYVEVSAQNAVALMLPYPGLGSALTLSSMSTARLR
jgi:Flp pilus assembly protein TadG